MAVVLESAISALVRSYMERRDVGVRELARRIGRDPSAVSKLVNSQSRGMRALRLGDQDLLGLVVAELRIPAREVKQALAIEFGFQGR